MARQTNRLSARTVSTTQKPGLHPDGGGLYLQVTANQARSWVYRYMLNRRAREMGLGSADVVTLAEARALAAEARKMRATGIDPIEARTEERARDRLGAAASITFKEAATAYIRAHRTGWRNAKHADQWQATLQTYAYPIIGSQPVQHVDTALVLKVLEPIWSEKPETASRVRGRIEAVLDREIALGHRPDPNPARWRGNLDHALPRRSRVRAVKHHPALPYGEIGAFMAALRERTSVSAAALEFLILTAARTGEVLGTTWTEFDLHAMVWTVPADRMKSGREHRVPLSKPAITVLERMAVLRGETDTEAFVFPGGRVGKPLSNMALLAVLRHMGRGDLTTHGFRSTFRDWAAERTGYPREVAEAALAHAVPDRTEAAYRRGDLFDKRRRLMDAWAETCSVVQPAGEVVVFDAAAG